VRFALARELHDAVAQSLATMLLEMEGFKAEQVGRASVLREIDELTKTCADQRMVVDDQHPLLARNHHHSIVLRRRSLRREQWVAF